MVALVWKVLAVLLHEFLNHSKRNCMYIYCFCPLFFDWIRMLWYSGMESKLRSLSIQETPSEVQVGLGALNGVAVVFLLQR